MNKKCNLCNHKKFDNIVKIQKNITIKKCRNCGLLFVYPLPSIKKNKTYLPQEIF